MYKYHSLWNKFLFKTKYISCILCRDTALHQIGCAKLRVALQVQYSAYERNDSEK